jgi:two-component system KDP operon response regulator KdpE
MLTPGGESGLCGSMAAHQLLLVEDDPQIVRGIVPALQVCGHDVTVASHGRGAIAHLDGRPWDVVVVDLGLPDMDGRAVVRHARAGSAVPVIVISAQDSTHNRAECAQAGASMFLGKPFSTPELIRFLAAVVGAAPEAEIDSGSVRSVGGAAQAGTF